MKIGDFAKKFNVKNDTVRYYIDLGILNPQKINNQYRFDENNIETMKEIIELKKLKFTLTEIQKILSLKRITNLISRDELEVYYDILKSKLKEIEAEESNLRISKNIIHEKLAVIEEIVNKKEMKIGFPVLFLRYIQCPDCGNELTLNSANITNNKIYSGELTCKCGYKIRIDDGILETSERIERKIGKTFSDYKETIENVNPEYIAILHSSLEKMITKIKREDFRNKIFLELGTGSGLFLKNIINCFDSSNTYIVTDENINSIKSVKNIIEKSGIEINIIFIAGNYFKLPFSEKIADVVIDYFGSLSSALKVEYHPVEGVVKYLKNDCKWYGAYSFFEENSKTFYTISKKIGKKPQNILFYTYTNVFEKYFDRISSSNIGYIDNPQENKDFHFKGDKMFIWNFYGTKK